MNLESTLIVLASESPRRKDLLKKLIPTFEVIPSNLAEIPILDELPNAYAARMSMEKAAKVSADHPDKLVIGSDTVVALKDRILGKPSTSSEAELMLSSLSGHWHDVWTGVSVMCSARNIQETTVVRSEVCFRGLNQKEIEEYVETGEPMDKAGSYAIQGGAKKFVKQIKGSYHNIIGLPTLELSRIFMKIGIEVDSNTMRFFSKSD